MATEPLGGVAFATMLEPRTAAAPIAPRSRLPARTQTTRCPAENRGPGPTRTPPPIPKKPDNTPTRSAALATGTGLRVWGFQSWQTLLVDAGESASAA